MKVATHLPSGQNSESAYVGDNVCYRLAEAFDQEALQALLSQNSMDSWIRLSLERRPDYFAGERLMGESRTVLAHELGSDERVVGMYACRRLPVHIDGCAMAANYLSGLRVQPFYRHRLRILRQGFASIRELMPEAWLGDHWFTSVASGNVRARRLLEGGLPGLPCYTMIGEMDTLAFSTSQGQKDGSWRAAQPRDIPALSDFYNRGASRWQFAPVLSEVWLASLDGSNGLHLGDFRVLMDGPDVHGCIAVWDQRHCKQTVVRGYREPFGSLRIPYNFWARLSRRPELPMPGRELDAVFLAFAMFASPDAQVAVAGVRSGLAAAMEKNARLGVIGLSVSHPLLAELSRRLNASHYRSCIETVHWSQERATTLATCLPQPEVAIL